MGARKEAKINKVLKPGTRVTVDMKPERRGTFSSLDEKLKKAIERGTKLAVAPSVPRTQLGLYWGYSVRLASSLSAVFTEAPYAEGYDHTIGTSDKGDNVYGDVFKIPKFNHLLIVFGGLKGLEYSLETDESLQVEDVKDLFDSYVNTCPSQGSGTIRTEEAILISLAAVRSKFI